MLSKKRSEVGLMSKKVISRRSQPMKKKVSRKAAEPPPPAHDVSDNWRPGDVVEVFDKVSWKMAVLSQVLGKKSFLVRPIGSSTQFKVGKANIRERVSWTHDTCDAIEQDFCNRTDAECNESSNVKYDENRRSRQISTNFGPNDADSFACSVGSCSIASNDMNEFPLRPSRDQIEGNDGDFSNAESILRSEDKIRKENMRISSKEELEAEIHELELHAYRCTMEALHASGPLSWEKEELVTNLRISLHITNDEHLVELRTLISANTRYTIKTRGRGFPVFWALRNSCINRPSVESIRNSSGKVRLDLKDEIGSSRSSRSARCAFADFRAENTYQLGLILIRAIGGSELQSFTRFTIFRSVV